MWWGRRSFRLSLSCLYRCCHICQRTAGAMLALAVLALLGLGAWAGRGPLAHRQTKRPDLLMEIRAFALLRSYCWLTVAESE